MVNTWCCHRKSSETAALQQLKAVLYPGDECGDI